MRIDEVEVLLAPIPADVDLLIQDKIFIAGQRLRPRRQRATVWISGYSKPDPGILHGFRERLIRGFERSRIARP
jgi:hypothetical protein